MQIYLASDHAGFELKNMLAQFLRGQGNDVVDMGPATYIEGDDYPDYCMPLAHKVAQNKGSFGIVIGVSGQGEAIAANRVKGVRAAVYYGEPSQNIPAEKSSGSPQTFPRNDSASANILKLSRQHNDANVLALGARFISGEAAVSAALLWLSTPFSNDERHIRRIEKLDA